MSWSAGRWRDVSASEISREERRWAWDEKRVIVTSHKLLQQLSLLCRHFEADGRVESAGDYSHNAISSSTATGGSAVLVVDMNVGAGKRLIGLLVAAAFAMANQQAALEELARMKSDT
jgi:hypothetical protein